MIEDIYRPGWGDKFYETPEGPAIYNAYSNWLTDMMGTG